ncbi:fasciclin domain-containing protein [Dinghuibacter silviterrae]|uniref:Putative surface protein with fasciclin (FAS1) repeats n=1 Tax=Dinghuibacter silviterrae TaxID=1539049 RepID=A0A4R8DHN9_9BACT|nr:fasciclin domain-containing protein [Dinghuibacter silviterrae]TDW97241.1 putative surface protein with fasciclin (FAS1) repeats [Dinghuibacter silviterrae]
MKKKLTLILLLASSCTKYPAPKGDLGPELTLSQYTAQDTNFRLYNLALQRSGMATDTTFASGGPYTIYVPMNGAMQGAGFNQQTLATYDTARLRGILEYGILNGRLSGASLTGTYSETVTCLNPLFQPELTKNYYGIFLDGVPVVKPDIPVSEGVIQATDRMVLPPTGTLMQEIDSLPELTIFGAAVRHIARFRNLLENPAPVKNNGNGTNFYGITLLAPNNSAFKDFGFPDTASIQQADSNYMYNLLYVYFFPGEYYTSDFKGGITFGGPYFNYSGNGALFSIEADGITFQSAANVQYTVQIVKPDISATNGVIHELNYILFP